MKKTGRTKANRRRGAALRARLAVRVQPGASRDALVGKLEGVWRVAVRAPAVEGRANRACLEYLARRLGRPRSALTIVRGESSRQKLIQVEGISERDVEVKLAMV